MYRQSFSPRICTYRELNSTSAIHTSAELPSPSPFSFSPSRSSLSTRFIFNEIRVSSRPDNETSRWIIQCYTYTRKLRSIVSDAFRKTVSFRSCTHTTRKKKTHEPVRSVISKKSIRATAFPADVYTHGTRRERLISHKTRIVLQLVLQHCNLHLGLSLSLVLFLDLARADLK